MYDSPAFTAHHSLSIYEKNIYMDFFSTVILTVIFVYNIAAFWTDKRKVLLTGIVFFCLSKEML